MNRRDFNISAMWAVTTAGLLVPAASPLARLCGVSERLCEFRTGADYWLKTALRIDNDQEWDGAPLMFVRDIQDGDAILWSWCINQYNEDDPVHTEVNVEVPYDCCYGPLPSAPLTPGPWHKFVWHLRFSETDGLIEGWWNDQKILELNRPNVNRDLTILSYERGEVAGAHLSRVDWTKSA